MKRNRRIPILLGASLLFLTAWCAPDAFGVNLGLGDIPPLAGDTSNDGRAITWDGQFIVGQSGGARGYLWAVGTAGSTNVLSGDGAQSQYANGVGWRTDINQANQKQLVISGMTSSGEAEFMTPDGGTTFANKRRNANWTYSMAMGAANQLGAKEGTDQYFVTSRATDSLGNLVVGSGTGLWQRIEGVGTNTPTMVFFVKGISSAKGSMNMVAASGRAVGWRGPGSTTSSNYWLTSVGLAGGFNGFFTGLAGDLEGQAYSVSADGNTVFGFSPITPGDANRYGYKTTFSSVPLTNNATTQGPVIALPEYADTSGSVTRAAPYGCTPDGKYAVGMNYRGMEKAVVWDTSNADPSKWTVVDLTDLAAANGGVGIFTGNLRRAYSVGTNATDDLVITGWGWAGATRGFVMTVPKWVAAIQFPISQTVNFGANVTFSLKTNGLDSLTYQWYKNGAELTGETGTSLSFANVSCAGGQAGDYTVVVSNIPVSGVVTGAMTLTVRDPLISAQPSSRTNLVNTVASFTVAASGSAALTYQWKFGGIDLTDGPTGRNSIVAGATTATLWVTNVQFADAGTYTVEVKTGGACPTLSAARTLTVVGVPVLSSIEAANGSYTLNVLVPAGQIYKVLYSTDIKLPLSSWTPLYTNTSGGGPEAYFDLDPADPQRFYILASPYVITP